MMTLQDFKAKLAAAPNEIQFANTIAVIESLYTFIPSSFKNGDIVNESDQNNGSCKLLAFTKEHGCN